MSRTVPLVPANLTPITRETPGKWFDYYAPKLRKVKELKELEALAREANTAIVDVKFFVPRELRGKLYAEYINECELQKSNFEHEARRIIGELEQKAMLEARLLADEVTELTIKTFDQAFKQVQGIGEKFGKLFAKQKELRVASSRASTFKARHPNTPGATEYKDYFAPWHIFDKSGNWTEQEAKEAFAQELFSKLLKG